MQSNAFFKSQNIPGLFKQFIKILFSGRISSKIKLFFSQNDVDS
jgi:hypothetical protein